MRLKDKIVLITGSARGIGQAIAELFHENGAIVIISDIDDEMGMLLTKKLEHNSDYIHLDVGDENDWKKAENFIVEKYKKLDILINNAGITGFLENKGPFDAENADLETWENVNRVNSTGVMLGCKTFLITITRS